MRLVKPGQPNNFQNEVQKSQFSNLPADVTEYMSNSANLSNLGRHRSIQTLMKSDADAPYDEYQYSSKLRKSKSSSMKNR